MTFSDDGYPPQLGEEQRRAPFLESWVPAGGRASAAVFAVFLAGNALAERARSRMSRFAAACHVVGWRAAEGAKRMVRGQRGGVALQVVLLTAALTVVAVIVLMAVRNVGSDAGRVMDATDTKRA